MAFTITKGMRMPKRAGGRLAQYPWDELEVGDSFFIPEKSSKTFGSAASTAAKARGIKLSLRTVEEGGVIGIRIWRLEDSAPTVETESEDGEETETESEPVVELADDSPAVADWPIQGETAAQTSSRRRRRMAAE